MEHWPGGLGPHWREVASFSCIGVVSIMTGRLPLFLGGVDDWLCEDVGSGRSAGGATRTVFLLLDPDEILWSGVLG
jgi:hypothetical protein